MKMSVNNMNKLNEYTCSVCGKTFLLSKKQKEDLVDAANHHIHSFIINCPICHKFDIAQPLVLLGLEDGVYHVPKDQRLFCCPIAACIGFIEKDEDSLGHYGCPECGTQWENEESIYKDIEKIIMEYPYRKQVYQKIGNTFRSIAFDEIPNGYYDDVQKEEIR